MLYEHEAKLEVHGAFPLDMLRRDRCYPASEAGAAAIARSIAYHQDESFCVTVKALSKSKEHWTEARWRSFDVQILDSTTRKA